MFFVVRIPRRSCLFQAAVIVFYRWSRWSGYTPLGSLVWSVTRVPGSSFYLIVCPHIGGFVMEKRSFLLFVDILVNLLGRWNCSLVRGIASLIKTIRHRLWPGNRKFFVVVSSMINNIPFQILWTVMPSAVPHPSFRRWRFYPDLVNAYGRDCPPWLGLTSLGTDVSRSGPRGRSERRWPTRSSSTKTHTPVAWLRSPRSVLRLWCCLPFGLVCSLGEQ